VFWWRRETAAAVLQGEETLVASGRDQQLRVLVEETDGLTIYLSPIVPVADVGGALG
jgi:hypothetical protein